MLGIKKKKKKHHACEEEDGGVCRRHRFLRELVPRSQPGFPEGAASRWLLERCKLHRLPQAAGDDNALESHLFQV